MTIGIVKGAIVIYGRGHGLQWGNLKFCPQLKEESEFYFQLSGETWIYSRKWNGIRTKNWWKNTEKDRPSPPPSVNNDRSLSIPYITQEWLVVNLQLVLNYTMHLEYFKHTWNRDLSCVNLNLSWLMKSKTNIISKFINCVRWQKDCLPLSSFDWMKYLKCDTFI